MAIKALDKVIASEWSTDEQKAEARAVRMALYNKTTKAATWQGLLDVLSKIPVDAIANNILGSQTKSAAGASKKTEKVNGKLSKHWIVPLEFLEPIGEMYKMNRLDSNNLQLQYLTGTDMMKMNQPEAYAPYQAMGEALDLAGLAIGAWGSNPTNFIEFIGDEGAELLVRELTDFAFRQTTN